MELEHVENAEQAGGPNYTVLSISKMFDKKVLNGESDTPLTNQDIEIIDQLINQAIQSYNVNGMASYKVWSEKRPNAHLNKDEFLIDLTKYKRQYFCAANVDGEKEVWINCFCHDLKWWRTGLVFVLDGGKCYFQMTVNLHTKRVLSFGTNGEA